MIPVLDEDEVVDHLITTLLGVLDRLPSNDAEVVVVDDGSTDDTREKLRGWVARDNRVKAVFLSRNFGHQSAVTAGLEIARGDIIVVMDGDMQDDPNTIPAMIAKHDEGFDVVYAIRRDRAENLWKRMAYWMHYRVGARVSDIQLPVDAGDFGLMSRRVLDEVNRLPEHLRYVRGLRAWVGFRQTGIEVTRHARAAGTSKYTVRALVRLSLDGLLGFSIMPLRLSILAGIAILAATSGFGIYVLVDRLITGQPPEGFASLALLSLALNGTVLIMLGIVGEYVGRIYLEVKQRPSYIVEEIVERHDG
ncbi:MAG TPA: glycosyltransferase family 2 protein [Acidimicrobiia bacterium]|nr:glycosyltransferase family 2 protein [Acidimicrobiia bacterium]